MEAAQCKKEVARCANGAEFSKQALDQIEGLVDDIYERKRIMLSEMENAVEDGCLKRLADCERSLAVEKYKHANCDSRIQELQSQLEAANRTSDIMMSLSATRCSRNLNRSLNSSKSTFAVKLNALELSVFPDGNKENCVVDGKVSDVMLTLEAPPRLSEQQAGKLKLLNESALKKIKQMDSL
uniref:Uncharacterized protein n=1 Tax=Ciona savignyi TaxID=51511 RepID=H2YDC5_CIOSA